MMHVPIQPGLKPIRLSENKPTINMVIFTHHPSYPRLETNQAEPSSLRQAQSEGFLTDPDRARTSCEEVGPAETSDG